jgi:hypothetical protein
LKSHVKFSWPYSAIASSEYSNQFNSKPISLLAVVSKHNSTQIMLLLPKSKSKSHCDWRSINQKFLMSSHIWGSWPDIYYTSTVTVLFFWGALYDERTGLSFVYAADPRQHSLYRVGVPWDSWPYFIASDLRLPFSSPPTTRRATVVFGTLPYNHFSRTTQKTQPFYCWEGVCRCIAREVIRLLLAYSLPRKYVYRVVA